MLLCVCVQNVLHAGMYLRRAGDSAFHEKLFLINQFMEPGEPRPFLLPQTASSTGLFAPPAHITHLLATSGRAR